MNNQKAIARIVHEGQVLRSIGELRIDIRIDPVVMRRANDAANAANKALAGFATRVSSLNRPDERNVIDQE